MPPEDPPAGDDQDQIDDALDAASDSTPASTALPAADVRNSPEYKALARQNRKLARDLGTATVSASAARTSAEEARLAAEVTQQAALDAQLTAELGEDGIAFWSEFAELSQTNPVAAAKRLTEFRASGVPAQSGATDGVPAANDPAAGEGGKVPAQTPPPPARGVDGGAPLNSAQGDDSAAVIASLTKTFTDTVGRVQDPITRNRVTMKDRAAGFISFLGAAYVQATDNKPADRRR